MTPRLLLLCVSLVGAILTAVFAAAAPPADARASASQGGFVLRGVVKTVVDGDTITARLDNGRTERVRLIGIDTPERGACFFSQASARTRAIALGQRVVLRGDTTQDTRDRYGRLLAYVDVRGSIDLGRTLIQSGHAHVYVYKRPFQRVATYRAREAGAKAAPSGLWSACAAPPPAPASPPVTPPPVTPPPVAPPPVTPPPVAPPPVTPPPATPPPSGKCDPSYPTVCIPPPPPDLDCKDIPHRNFVVIGADPHRFDGNRDGRGCER